MLVSLVVTFKTINMKIQPTPLPSSLLQPLKFGNDQNVQNQVVSQEL